MPIPKGTTIVQRIERTCAVCARSFFVTPGYLAAKQKQRGDRACLYCSKACQHASLAIPIVDGIKVCSGCNQDLPLVSFTMLHGEPRPKCKSCSAAIMRQHRAKHPEQRDARIAAKRAWDEANREHVRAERHRYHIEHREELAEKQRARNTGPDRARFLARGKERYGKLVASGYVQRYYEANRDRWRQRERQLWREHPERRLEKDAQRRARKLGTQREPVDRLAIIARDASTCYLCKTVLDPARCTLDHVVPLIRGGAHAAENIRVACKPCNSRKHKKLLSELNWSEQDGWLVPPRPATRPGTSHT